MSITQKQFGTLDGQDVISFILDNGCGLKAEILNLGGIIRRLIFKGTDVVLARENVHDCYIDDAYMGALIGRTANRINGGEFILNGKKYTLAKNDSGVSCLHGGNIGFNKKIWTVTASDSAEPQLVLETSAADGEEGYPGNVNVKVTYTLTKENSIKIHYEGTTDADTLLNMTNHAYFNLNGCGNIDNHTLWLDANFFSPSGTDCMPTGEVLSVKNTPFDFTEAKNIGSGFSAGDRQIDQFGGYDHNFALNGIGFRKTASLTGDITKIKMDMYTDLPGVQIYTCNFIDPDAVYKDGAKYDQHYAVCLETQSFPDSIHFPHFPSAILRKGQKYDTVTEYKFSKDN